MENSTETTFDDEFPRDGATIKDIRLEMTDDTNYNLKRTA
jgi:hypothetical protein